MKNKLVDLNDHLFAEMERLGDEDLKGDALIEEISRAKAISDVATRIVDNASLILKAATTAADVMDANYKVPSIIGLNAPEPKATIKGTPIKNMSPAAQIQIAEKLGTKS